MFVEKTFPYLSFQPSFQQYQQYNFVLLKTSYSLALIFFMATFFYIILFLVIILIILEFENGVLFPIIEFIDYMYCYYVLNLLCNNALYVFLILLIIR